MDDFQTAANIYSSLLRKNFSYALSDGNKFEFFFDPRKFKHMIGLHKLKDLKLPQNNVTLFNRVLKGVIPLSYIKNSGYYSKIEDRIRFFPEINNLLFLNSAYEFNKSIIVCSLNTKYFFYNDKNGIGLYFGVAYDNGKNYYYPETFFPRSHDPEYYIKNQKQLNVLSLSITPKYNYNYHFPEPVMSRLDAVRNVIGVFPSYDDILKGINSINNDIQGLAQQKALLQSQESQYKKLEQYIISMDEAAASLDDLNGNNIPADLYKKLSERIKKYRKLISLSSFKNVDDFHKEYSRFLLAKNDSMLELNSKHDALVSDVNILQDALSSMEDYYHNEVVTFYKNDYPGATKWSKADICRLRKFNESHGKALTFDEISRLDKSPSVISILKLFNSASRSKEIER